jgi:predicted ABC-type ATPase
MYETVPSDPLGQNVEFLQSAVASGYNVVFCFIGVRAADLSDERVAMRVLQGGHDVPTDKLQMRFPRSLRNLSRALLALPDVWVFDNSDLAQPFRRLAVFERAALVSKSEPWPAWFSSVVAARV